MKSLCCILVAGGVLSLCAGSYVAEPDRAKSIQWKTYPRAGHDFWMLLTPSWMNLKGVSEERFVQESGTALQVMTSHNPERRIISIGEMNFYGKNGQKILPRIEVSPGEKDALVIDPENLTDGKAGTFCVVSGNVLDVKRRCRTIAATFRIRSGKPVKNFTIAHGAGKDARIGKIALKTASAETQNKDGLLQCKLAKPSADFEFTVESVPERYTALPFKGALAERLKKYPFYLEPPVRFSLRNLMGLHSENIDKESFEKIEKEYEKTFIGYRIAEWDSNFLAMLRSPASECFRDLKEYIDIPCGKEGMLKNFKTFWDYHRALFGKKVFGMSGMVNFEHHALSFGGTVSALEITSEHKDHQHRNNYIFLRGSARQFDVPMMMYFAYYMNLYTASSSSIRRKALGLDFGAPPSLSLRNFYISYYMGVNYLDFECQWSGQVKKNPDNTYSLTGNGRSLKDIFEWSRSPKGKRGNSYAPILLLADRKHGYDAWHRYSSHWNGTCWNIYPLTDGDLLLEYVMQTVNPHGGYGNYTDASFIGNLRNSTLGDIFDLYVCNPYQSDEVRLPQLEKYPVAFLVTDLTYTNTLANTFKQYVFNGGTLILTAGQIQPYANDPGFLGASPEKTFIQADGLTVRNFALEKKTEVLMQTSGGTPLVLKNRYGKGHVILITSPSMKKTKDIYKVPPQMLSMLEKIQAELLPVKIEGDCQYLFNVMPDGTWKVILINNRGIIKAPWESYEKHDPAYTREVKIIAPAGTKAVELRNNAEIRTESKDGKTVYSLRIPPAQIMVVDIAGIKKARAQKIGRKEAPPVKDFVEKPYVPALPDDGYKLKSHLANTEKAPEVIGRWTAGNGFRDALGKHDMKLNNIAPQNGKMVFHGKTAQWAETSLNVKYLLPEGTWMIWAKPVPQKDFPCVGKNGFRRGGLVYGYHLMLEYINGHWSILTVAGHEISRITGPRALPEWTHLAVTWKNGFVRFYVNGKEVRKNTGPLKLTQHIAVNAFRKTIPLTLGMLSPQWPVSYVFAGELGDFTFLGRALTQEELAENAGKK